MTTKKGMELTLGTVVIAILVLIVLVVVILIFTGNLGKINTKLGTCDGRGGVCSVGEGKDCQDGYVKTDLPPCTSQEIPEKKGEYQTCCIPLGR